MAEARVELVGDQIEVECITFSHLYALIHNCHRDKNTPAIRAEQIYRPSPRKGDRKHKPDFITKDVSIFKTVFIHHKLPDARHEPRPRNRGPRNQSPRRTRT